MSMLLIPDAASDKSLRFGISVVDETMGQSPAEKSPYTARHKEDDMVLEGIEE